MLTRINLDFWLLTMATTTTTLYNIFMSSKDFMVSNILLRNINITRKVVGTYFVFKERGAAILPIFKTSAKNGFIST